VSTASGAIQVLLTHQLSSYTIFEHNSTCNFLQL